MDVFAVNISWSADWKHMPVRDIEVEGGGDCSREGIGEWLSGEGESEI